MWIPLGDQGISSAPPNPPPAVSSQASAIFFLSLRPCSTVGGGLTTSVSISLSGHQYCVSFFAHLAACLLPPTCLFSLSLPPLLCPIYSAHIPLTSTSPLSSCLCPLLVSSFLCLCSSFPSLLHLSSLLLLSSPLGIVLLVGLLNFKQ